MQLSTTEQQKGLRSSNEKSSTVDTEAVNRNFFGEHVYIIHIDISLTSCVKK